MFSTLVIYNCKKCKKTHHIYTQVATDSHRKENYTQHTFLCFLHS